MTLIDVLSDPVVVAAIFTVIGGLLLKLSESLINGKKEKRDDRTELREEITQLRERLDTVEEEVTFWRNRFYEEQEDNAMLRVLMIQAGMTPPHKVVGPPEK